MSPEKLARFADSWKYFVCPLCREELRLEVRVCVANAVTPTTWRGRGT